MPEKKDKRGGARPGAGRKKNEITLTPRNTTIYMTDEQWEAFDKLLQDKDMKLGTYLNAYCKKVSNKIIKEATKDNGSE